MPCQSDESLGRNDQKAELDLVTRLLCVMCQEAMKHDGFHWNVDAVLWYRKHEELDKKRQQLENREKHLKEVRRVARAKLTHLEREALGV